MSSSDSSSDTAVVSAIQQGMVVTLSGGGIRAAAFHLGVLKRLASAGLLESITGLSTVSGGSLLVAAVFAQSGMHWPSSREFEAEVFPRLRHMITQSDLLSLRGIGIPGLWRYNKRIFYDRARILADQLAIRWGIKGSLRDLPDTPVWYINATCLETGKNWRFAKREMGDWVAGRHYAPPFTVAEAAAASAAVPYAIGSLRLSLPKEGWQRTDPATSRPLGRCTAPFEFVHLWDGGAYENLGLEAFYKPGEPLRKGNFLICSDASAPLGPPTSGPMKMLWQGKLWAPRLFDISSDQIRSLRTRMLIRDFASRSVNGILVRMGNSARDIDVKAGIFRDAHEYAAFLTDEETSLALAHPTDLQAPSEMEFDRIARHGFEVTDSTFKAYASGSVPARD